MKFTNSDDIKKLDGSELAYLTQKDVLHSTWNGQRAFPEL